jgi:hypothetical protein
MSYISRIIRNASATYQLKPRYYWLTTIIGLLAVLIALCLWCPLFLKLLELAGMDLNTQLNGIVDVFILIAVFVVLMIPCIYTGIIFIAGPFCIYMILTGKFSKKEAFEYILYSEYPARWFPEAITKPSNGAGEAARRLI